MTMAASSVCPVCGNAATVVARQGIYDDRYGYPGSFVLRHCPACDHRFLDAAFSPEELGRLYTEFYPRKELPVEAWRPHPQLGAFRTWLAREKSAAFRWVPRNVRVLDIGCGFGQSLGYHRARGCDVAGIDPDENLRRVAAVHGLNARVGLFRAEDYPRDSFDYVTLDQVIEHAADPIGLLRGIAAILRPGGKLVLATPNGSSAMARLLGNRWVHLHTPYHLQLFSARSLVTAARRANLRVVTLHHITQPKWYGFQWLHLLARQPAGSASPFWTTSKPWRRARVPIRKLISALGRIGMNHAVAAVLDLLRVGDNLVVILERPRE